MKLATIFLLALCALPAHAAISGGLRVNTDTTGTNTTSVRVTVSGQTNLNTGALNATNSVKVISLTGDRVAIVHSDNTITNSFITVTWLNALSNIVGNIQDQINNIISGNTNNWMNEGATNSTLAGIGKPWALEVTNSVQVGALGEAGLIDIASTNGTYAALLSVDSTGAFTLLSLGDAAGTAFIINSSNTVTFPGLLLDIQNAGVSKFQVTEEGGVLADDDLRVEDPGDVSRFALLEHDALRVTDKLSLYPRQADGFTPYLMDTFLTHTGGSMLQVLNLGTLEFNVAANSGYTGGGTLFLSDDGTYKSPSFDTLIVSNIFATNIYTTNIYATEITVTNTFISKGNSFNSNLYTINLVVSNTATVNGINVLNRAYGAACSDLTTPLTTGTVKGIIRLPHAMTLTEVRASLLTAQTGGSTFTVNVEENGTTVLSTPITIDNGETSSVDAAVPPVISDSALADDSIITFDIDQVGDGTAIGLQVWIIGTIAP